MHPVIRIVFLIILVLVSSVGTAPGQQAATSLAKPNPAPTPIPLAKVPLEAQSALASLQEIDANVSGDQSSADCASKGTLASGMGVGAGFGFASEVAACWPGAVPTLETKTRIIRKTIRITGCMERKRESERAAHFAWLHCPNRGVDFIDQGFLTNVQLMAPAARQARPVSSIVRMIFERIESCHMLGVQELQE